MEHQQPPVGATRRTGQASPGTANPPLQPSDRGEVFGPYRVFERLGAGGMATVHRAYHQPPGGPVRQVALKRLLAHLADDESFVRAFVREAKLASLLEHPNIVKIYELGRVGGTYFMSMEYLPGQDLRCVLRQARRIGRQPPLSVTLCLVQQMLQGLDYAHRSRDLAGTPLGIVHRDVSPANLLVNHSGHLTIIDFGIAKAQTQQFLTHTGRVKGKLAYMAPEAAMGQAIDARSDLFSAGIVLHELLTVRPLFACKNEYETLQKLQRCDVPRPSARNGAVPPELDAIALRALAKAPGDRFASASEFSRALAAFAADRRLLATPREVQGWCEWLFSDIGHAAGTNEAIGLAPETKQWRRPTATLTNAYAELVAHNDTEEIDIVVEELWDRPQPLEAVPVVLDEVPDVSSRVAARGDKPLPAPAFSDPLQELVVARARTTAVPPIRPAPGIPARPPTMAPSMMPAPTMPRQTLPAPTNAPSMASPIAPPPSPLRPMLAAPPSLAARPQAWTPDLSRGLMQGSGVVRARPRRAGLAALAAVAIALLVLAAVAWLLRHLA